MRIVLFFSIILFGISVVNASNYIALSGKIKVKGSEPNTYIVLKDTYTNKNYKIENYKEFNLQRKQNKLLNLKVEILQKSMDAGFPAVVKVVEVKN